MSGSSDALCGGRDGGRDGVDIGCPVRGVLGDASCECTRGVLRPPCCPSTPLFWPFLTAVDGTLAPSSARRCAITAACCCI